METLVANKVAPDQTPHNVASDLVYTVFLLPFYGFPGKNGLTRLSNFILWLTLIKNLSEGFV